MVYEPHHCPACGSVSSDAEFCSECGASMGGAAVEAQVPAQVRAQVRAQVPGPVAVAPSEGPELCPVCGEARPGPFARYCDNCRYDFLAKRPFDAAVVAAPATLVPPLPEVAPGVGPTPRWDLDGSVDVSLRRPDDPMPSDLRPRMFPLDMADHLIGRRSDSADIHPEITVPDPGISRRHARILRGPDGALSLVDLGSMNGTRLNGAAVEPNVAVPLTAGDEVTLGCWTRLIVRAR